MSSKVYEQAVALTNRADLQSETVTGIGLALGYYHSLEDWSMDEVSVKVLSKQDGDITYVDLSTLNPRFRFLNSVSIGGVVLKRSDSGIMEQDTYTLSGKTLQFNASVGSSCGLRTPEVTINYQGLPNWDTDNCEVKGSWIADAHPEIIARYASAFVKSVIEDRSMGRITLDEQTLLRTYLEV